MRNIRRRDGRRRSGRSGRRRRSRSLRSIGNRRDGIGHVILGGGVRRQQRRSVSGPLLETGSGGIERWGFGSATRRKEAKPPLDKVVRRLLRLDLTLLRSCALSALGVRFGVLVVDTLGENLKGVRITDLVARVHGVPVEDDLDAIGHVSCGATGGPRFEPAVEDAHAANVPKMTNDAMDLLGGDMKAVLFDDLQYRLDEIVVSAIDEIGTAREGEERSYGIESRHYWVMSLVGVIVYW